MSLKDYIKKSDEIKRKDSCWISTYLGDEGEITCEKYIGEEIIKGQFGDQVVITVMADGKEMKLGRPFPLSSQSTKFFEELEKIKDNPPFIIVKKTNQLGRPEYFAKPAK